MRHGRLHRSLSYLHRFHGSDSTCWPRRAVLRLGTSRARTAHAMTTRAECIAKAAEEMKVEPFKGPFSAEPYDSARWFVADGLRRAVSPLISKEAAQWLCDRLNAAPARDAAPIVGEREAFEAWASDNIDRLIAAHLGVDETTQFGKRIAASFLCAAAWNARAALPSGGGAREAAVIDALEIAQAADESYRLIQIDLECGSPESALARLKRYRSEIQSLTGGQKS